ncbi:MAG: methionyl-tRNA formyltransferase [Acidobacteriota bacterium]
MLRAVFFGTPAFAGPSLTRLASDAEVRLVVTQPDRPVGRRAALRPSAISEAAASLGIRTEKPERLRDNASFLETLAAARADVGVVVAYGKLLPDEVLAAPRLGFVNVHASLLPRHRGASPVQAAILAGDRETGVATMRVVRELDAGPLYLERRTPIEPREDAAALAGRLSELGADLLAATLAGLERGTLEARPQEGEPTFCRTIRREDGEADWSLPAAALDRRRRAFAPWPGLFTFLDSERIKILDSEVGQEGRAEPPGSFWQEDGELVVAAGGGTSLLLRRLQREGRSPVNGAQFALGARLTGRFGSSRP